MIGRLAPNSLLWLIITRQIICFNFSGISILDNNDNGLQWELNQGFFGDGHLLRNLFDSEKLRRERESRN